jgi:glycosyltransferase involved in cell wall biosynthesis
VPLKNTTKLAKSILYILNNPKYALKMGLKGREKAEKEFSETLIFERIQKEYKKLIQRKNLLNFN